MSHKYTEEQDQFLIANVKGISLKELLAKFNEKFNTNVTESGIANRKRKLNLHSGITGGQFAKGHIPYTKGKKWDEFMSKESQDICRKTCFSKNKRINNANNVPNPLYSERIDSDGTVLIKVHEKGNYVSKHRYLYEKYHNCKIPKGYICIFLDGNKNNFDISNLAVISKRENLIMNKEKLRYEEKELTESGIKLAKLIETVQKKVKENGKHGS